MDDARLSERHFHGDVATGAHKKRGQKRRYKETLKKSLGRLHTNPKTSEDNPEQTGLVKSSLRSKPDSRHLGKKGTSQVSGGPGPQHRHSTPPDMPALSTDIPRADRPRRSSSDPMHQPQLLPPRLLLIQPSRRPRRRPSSPPPSITDTSDITAIIITAVASTNTDTSTIPVIDRNDPNVPSTTNTFTIKTSHVQPCGLDPNLSPLRPHIRFTHRTVRSLANPSYRTGTPVLGAPTYILPHLSTPCTNAHGPSHSHAYPRQRNSTQYRRN
ncbi:hypothetical protein SprV_0401441500 [Sparganum proliferum]